MKCFLAAFVVLISAVTLWAEPPTIKDLGAIS